MVPVRGPEPLFEASANVMVPLPVFDPLGVTVIQETLLAAVHVHAAGVVTEAVSVNPVAVAVIVPKLIE